MKRMKRMINLRDAHDATIYGGKASGLARLISAAFPVQPGIAIAHDESPTGVDILSALLHTCRSVRFTLESKWAVRSSAIGEDGKDHAYAGQHDSFLNVEPWAIEKHVQLVRESLHNTRADSYRRTRDLTKAGMSIVVQRMVPDVRYSAVVFTRSPMNKNEICVEHAPCLGDELVSGKITPDSIITSHTDYLTLKDNKWVLLIGMALRAENYFDCNRSGIDIEAAYNGDWWLCQARPITTTREDE